MGEILQSGAKAPDFSAPVTPDQKVSLSDFKGRRLILAFYPADWSPVCGDQMSLYNLALPEFRRHGADLLGISVDGTWCHQAYAKANQLHFPLIADFHPKGEIARSYGAYRESEGVAERALFILDETGQIVWSHLSPIAVNPGADGILDALERMPKPEKADV
ncbi:thioredoxin peroxidase [Sphingobium sp. 22B]|uniref:redoxin domain-containing protein n=1 Tax=unclassified Sphingobium TaxID=2611147 RepID=UPI0007857AA2|nr:MULTISPECIES: redoxin domain-containing protein [unclassified Sphingobium]KXU31490.1 thioredoxin peroxidase [Sphingobium sp. AM]KYC31144.1 thioredoxin peroxidase [Sphingobium sp. 22B]OAP31146.1 thioredoxin peroxidase [Sphingobium sp. 20006FA]